MKLEVEGILKFTESERVKANREAVKRDSNSIFDFMESKNYDHLKANAYTSSKELYAVYCLWCDENLISPLKSRTFSDETMKCVEKYHLEHTNKFKNAEGRRAWGFLGIELLVHSNTGGIWGSSQCTYVPEEWQ